MALILKFLAVASCYLALVSIIVMSLNNGEIYDLVAIATGRSKDRVLYTFKPFAKFVVALKILLRLLVNTLIDAWIQIPAITPDPQTQTYLKTTFLLILIVVMLSVIMTLTWAIHRSGCLLQRLARGLACSITFLLLSPIRLYRLLRHWIIRLFAQRVPRYPAPIPPPKPQDTPPPSPHPRPPLLAPPPSLAQSVEESPIDLQETASLQEHGDANVGVSLDSLQALAEWVMSCLPDNYAEAVMAHRSHRHRNGLMGGESDVHMVPSYMVLS